VPDEHREQAVTHLLLGEPRRDLVRDLDKPLPLRANG
jgi:hypothetical protein